MSLTLRVAGEEFNVVKIIRAEDSLLTFSYYSDTEKSSPLPPDCGAEAGETVAWPALTVPYQAILWVELNPGKAARDREIGFSVPRDTEI